MGTVTLSKFSRIFSYQDFMGQKTARRLAEMSEVGVLPVYRTSVSAHPAIYMVSSQWFDGQITTYAKDQATMPAYFMTSLAEEALSRDFSSLVDISLARNQVESLTSKTNQLGPIHTQYMNLGFYSTKNFKEDGNYPLNSAGMNKFGANLAYMLNPAYYALLAATPAGAYAGTGNGSISQFTPSKGVLESFTLTCTAAALHGGTFSVTGSVSGALPPAIVNVPYSNPHVSFTILGGSVDFIVGDTMVLVFASANL